jgi:hypothetical protein
MSDFEDRLANLSPEKRKLFAILLEEEKERKQKIRPVSREKDIFPLSFSQKRLWFLSQLEPDSAIYNLPLAVMIRGDLNLNILEICVNKIIERHESLRTCFREENGDPIQIIHKFKTTKLAFYDYSLLPGSQRYEVVNDKASAFVMLPFNLEDGPLFFVYVFRVSELEHIVLLNMHHIISDGWSMGVLIDEIITMYEGYRSGIQPSLPELSIQYADYAFWQASYLNEKELEKSFKYWEEKLSGSGGFLDLPTDFARPVVRNNSGDQLSFKIQGIVLSQIRAFAKKQSLTIFSLLLAAFEVLLYRYSSQEDISIGTPYANRNSRELESLVGFFVNTLVMRDVISGNLNFRDFARMVQETTLGAFEHSDVPFEMLVDRLQPERNLSTTPLFQVMFILQNAPWKFREVSDLTMELLDFHSGTSKFDLTLVVSETQEELLCSVEYDKQLYSKNTISRLAHHYTVLLENLISEPDRQIDKTKIITADDVKELVYGWNETDYPIPERGTIARIFEEQVDRVPEREAVVAWRGEREERISYGELNRRANQLGRWLEKRGVERGDLVGLLVERSVEMMVGLLGILKVGGGYVPMDPMYPTERLGYIVEDLKEAKGKSPVVVAHSWLVEKLPAGVGEVVRIDEEWEEISRERGSNLRREVKPEDLAYVLYTSGSTGSRRG